MLQTNIMPYASDALEDAMRLAQTKALNSYTFSDCLNYLNYTWSDIYSRMAMIDDGYYGKTMKLTNKLTHLPDCVKNTVMVYRAQSITDYNRTVYRDAGTSDIIASGTYRISGKDLYCYDADRYNIWLYYVPACPQIFFTHHNRDPKLLDVDTEPVQNTDYSIYTLYTETNEAEQINKVVLKHKSGNSEYDKDITEHIVKLQAESDDFNGDWNISYISCDFPYNKRISQI